MTFKVGRVGKTMTEDLFCYTRKRALLIVCSEFDQLRNLDSSRERRFQDLPAIE